MFDESALRTSTVPISSAMPDRAALTTESVDRVHVRSRTSVPVASGSPAQPGRTRQVAPGSSTIAGPSTAAPGPSTRELEPVAVDERAAAAGAVACRRAEAGAGGERRHQPACDDLRLAVEPEAVAPLVRGVEVRLPALRVDRQLVRLAAVAGVDEATRSRARQVGSARASSSSKRPSRRDVVAAQVGDREPERAEHARRARDEHALDPELLGERARMQRPGAAEGDEREPARVDPALDADHAQRPRHLRVDDADDAERRPRRAAEPEPSPARARRAAGRALTSPPRTAPSAR